MMNEKSFITSESVTEGHPDKLADQISDGVLDAILKEDPMGRVACECMVATGLVMVAGQITTECYVDIPNLARKIVKEIGYTRAKYGFDETLVRSSPRSTNSPRILRRVWTEPLKRGNPT